MEEYKQPKYETEKVEILLEQINDNDPKLILAISICRDGHSKSFDDACQYMSKHIAVIYPQQKPNAIGRGKKRQQVQNTSTIKRKKGK